MSLKERLLCIQKEVITNFAENCKQKQSAIQTVRQMTLKSYADQELCCLVGGDCTAHMSA